MKLVFVTHNPNKVNEIRKIIPENFSLLSPADLGLTGEIPETGKSLEENALLKARFIWDKFKLSCFADDSGLEVDALNGAPGVYSARYAGEPKNDKKNTEKLLMELSGKDNRQAQFRTVIALILDGKECLFEGSVRGKIIREEKGKNGFGYDPVFVPDGFSKTFAELDTEDKNQISHRAEAMKKMIDFLNKGSAE